MSIVGFHFWVSPFGTQSPIQLQMVSQDNDIKMILMTLLQGLNWFHSAMAEKSLQSNFQAKPIF